MQLQSVGSPFQTIAPFSAPTYENPAMSLARNGQKGLRNGSPQSASLDASLQAEYLSVQKYSLEFTSKDGDTVSFSMESVQYQKTLLDIAASGSPEDMQKIMDYIKKEYESMKTLVLDNFLKKLEGKGGNQKVDDLNEPEEFAVPEYWNAENTSQRIVDFAVQFFDSFTGAGEDFLSLIKDAIEKGFAEARDMLGELPDPVAKLVNETHDLVMQKLDAWAREKGITVDAGGAGNVVAETAAAAV